MKVSYLETIKWQIIAIIGLNLAYSLVISDQFSYMGFSFDFDLLKFIIGVIILLFFLLLSNFIKDKFIYSVWHIIFIMCFVGEVIYYQYSKDTAITQIISVGLVLLFLIIVSRSNYIFDKPLKTRNLDFNILTMSLILFLPFLVFYLPYINIKNVFMIDVYQTRELFRQISSPMTGYIQSPLVRILLPILIINSLEKRNTSRVITGSLMIIYVYLCGAVKSVFIGLIAVFFFYKGDYDTKVNRFLKIVCFFSFLGIIFFFIFHEKFLLDTFIRRVFFVPPHLNNQYNEYFVNNHTYFTHSGLLSPFIDNGQIDSLSLYFGEKILGAEGFNANVGVFTEGFISFGYLGTLLFSFLIAFVFWILKMFKIDKKYFGLIFTYIYYFNTSFLSTLLITHGLLFLVVFCYFFLRRTEQNNKYTMLLEK